MGRQENVRIFEDTQRQYETNPRLRNAVSKSIEPQKLITERMKHICHSGEHRYNERAEVVVSRRRSFAAAMRYNGQKICVLNFASATNPGEGDRAVDISQDELQKLHEKRLRRVADIAAENGAEVLILGAFGCGAFRNPPEIVAQAMKTVVEKYRYCFKSIEMAVYCSPRDDTNYRVFAEMFG